MKKFFRKDPLHDIVERFLFMAETANSTEKFDLQMENKIVDEYLAHLKQHRIHIPIKFKKMFIDDVRTEIRGMTQTKSDVKIQIDSNEAVIGIPGSYPRLRR